MYSAIYFATATRFHQNLPSVGPDHDDTTLESTDESVPRLFPFLIRPPFNELGLHPRLFPAASYSFKNLHPSIIPPL